MSNYRLFSWGANSHGQLGHGAVPEEELLTPTEVDLSFTDIKIGKIKKIAGGAGHSLILDESGSVFSCGSTDKKQARTERPGSYFQRLENLQGQKIIDIACGWDSSMALTDRGELYAWGSNHYGQLGLDQLKYSYTTVKVKLEVPITKMSIGLRHSAVVTEDARVLVSGAATKGQLGIVGLPDARNSNHFVEVPGLQNIQDVACGQHHTVALTKNNEILSWGDNKHGQLGIDPGLHKKALSPIKINKNFEQDIHEIFCGWTHSVCMAGKEVFFWGRNTYGQLGRTKTIPANKLWEPELPTKLIKAQQIAVGSEHNIVLTDDGTIMSWGWNEHGNCGNGDNKDIFEPTKVLLPDCTGILVGAGAGHSFALVKTNN